MVHDTDRDFHSFEKAHRCQAAGFFAPGPVFLARAPGRLDVMGGIADYSGALVAELPIAQAAVAGAQPDPSGFVTVRTLDPDAGDLAPEVRLDPELFINPVSLLKYLRDAPAGERWAGYVAGCFALLRAEGEIPRGMGARLLLHSEVPLGAGVSSSAAIEVATMRALCAAFGVRLTDLAMARLCQRVENEIVDAPCGIMDQVTCLLGEADSLLLLLCQPHAVQGSLRLPDRWSAIGIDSRVKHSVAGEGYTRVRVAAFMGYKILADRARSGFGGFLCNVGPDRYRQIVADQPLPEALGGADFLARHGGILDTVTRVDPAQVYPVRAATEHPIFEHDRVQRFVACLRDGSSGSMVEAGRLMAGSHASYSACGLGSPATDLLVELATGGPWGAAVAGAKITGGGSGGTVCVLCRTERVDEIAGAVAAEYEKRAGVRPRIIRGTSSGALATPVRNG